MFRRMTLLVTLLSLALTACGNGDAGSGAQQNSPAGPSDISGEQGEAQAVSVAFVTTVFPLAWTAEQVAPDAEIALLASSGQDPHDLEMSPDQRVQIQSADLVAYMGQIDFQPQVEAAVADATGVVVSVADIAGDHVRRIDDRDHQDNADDDHADDEAVDPHLWFDLEVMTEVTEELGEAFAAVDAANAQTYRDNARQVQDDLVALDTDIDELLGDCRHDTAMVSHEAYAYLLEPRGLQQEGISGAGGHGEASPQRLATLTQRIRAEGITAVLAEPLEGRADAQALAAEAEVELLEIDPLEIADGDHLRIGYPALLEKQARAFAEALGCK